MHFISIVLIEEFFAIPFLIYRMQSQYVCNIANLDILVFLMNLYLRNIGTSFEVFPKYAIF